MDVSVLIPSRNEEYLQRTIDSVLANMEADTEVVVVLEGAWPDPPIPNHPQGLLVRVRVTHLATVRHIHQAIHQVLVRVLVLVPRRVLVGHLVRVLVGHLVLRPVIVHRRVLAWHLGV